MRRDDGDGAKADLDALWEALLGDAPLDLAYCDLMMGGVSGVELFATLRRRAPDRVRKLVFMTGGAFTGPAARFVESLGDAVVYKPFDVLAETRRRLR